MYPPDVSTLGVFHIFESSCVHNSLILIYPRCFHIGGFSLRSIFTIL